MRKRRGTLMKLRGGQRKRRQMAEDERNKNRCKRKGKLKKQIELFKRAETQKEQLLPLSQSIDSHEGRAINRADRR